MTEPAHDIKVFICYAREDLDIARRVYQDLQRSGVDAWLDTENLMAGQKWELIIQQAMKNSSYVLILLSRCSVSKRGFIQNEIRHALKLSDSFPTSAIFIIPARLEDCEPPDELHGLQWVDLFPDYEAGFAKLLPVFAPEGRDELLRRKIRMLTEEYTRLQREKGQETETDVISELESEMNTVQHRQRQAEQQITQPRDTPARNVAQEQQIEYVSAPLTLRSNSQIVSEDEVKQIFGLRDNLRPQQYIRNDFEDQGDVVVDRATGLMWQKAGSGVMFYNDAPTYIDTLNREQFAGYDDWRLPTIPELMSLLEPEKQSNDLYIDPIFDKKQCWCWSADRRLSGGSSSAAWYVYFDVGIVYWFDLVTKFYVRAVRS